MITSLLALQLAVAAPPPVEHHEHWLHATIAASVMAHGADLGITMYCRGARTCREVNPALAWLQDEPVAFGMMKMGVATGLSYLLLRLHERHPRITLALAVAQTVGVGYVAYRNQRQAPPGGRE